LFTRRRKPLLQSRAPEIDEKPWRSVGQPKVGQQLLGVSGVEPLDRLHLDQQLVRNDQVDAEGGFESSAFEFDVDRPLAIDRISHVHELSREHRFIDGFEQPRPELAMQPDRQIQDLSGDAVQLVQTPTPLRLRDSARTLSPIRDSVAKS
jgi:hypothetical protein